MKKPIRQKLMIPFFMCIGFLAMSVSAITRGIEAHQTWRIVLASASEVLFAAGIVIIIFAIRKENKTLKNSQA
ncbi:hypothetical protein FFF34_014220 [Inquilinus sp. KBS0705]|nr:hypothetical protein FFF34_014220 [Inquilinus sp. KBS0705]